MKPGGARGPARRLRYRVEGATSEDEEHPARDLLEHFPGCQGWQSRRFARFPQEVVLVLQEPCIVHELQILGNESKVASRLELFCMDEDRAKAGGTGPAGWRLLGECYFDPNIRSGFTARELKRISLDENATKIMLRLHRCHPNKLNIYNQVGLVAVIPIGWPRYQRPDRDVESLGPAVVDAALELGIDDKVMEVIREVNKAKDAAIEREDYERAKSLKLGIDRLKKIGIRVAQLESQKVLAVQMEDFDRARGIKEDIDKLRTNCHTLSVGMQGGAPQRRGVALLQQSRRKAEVSGMLAGAEGGGNRDETPLPGATEQSAPERAGGRARRTFLSKGGGRMAGEGTSGAADAGGGPGPSRAGVERPLPAPKAGDSSSTAGKRAPAKVRNTPAKPSGDEPANSKPVGKKPISKLPEKKDAERKPKDKNPSPTKKTPGEKSKKLSAATAEKAGKPPASKGARKESEAAKQAEVRPDVDVEALPREAGGDAKSAPKAEKAPSPKVEGSTQSVGMMEPSGEVAAAPVEKPKQEAQASSKTGSLEDIPEIKATAEKGKEPMATSGVSEKAPTAEEGPVEHDDKPIKSHSSYQSMIGSDSLGPDSVPRQ